MQLLSIFDMILANSITDSSQLLVGNLNSCCIAIYKVEVCPKLASLEFTFKNLKLQLPVMILWVIVCCRKMPALIRQLTQPVLSDIRHILSWSSGRIDHAYQPP